MTVSGASIRLSISSLILLALLAGQLLPSGFMPRLNGNRSSTIQICTASGLAEIFKPTPDTPVKSSPKSHSSLCPFAPILSAGATAFFIFIGPPFFTAALSDRAPHFPLIVEGVKPWQSQAPP